MKLRTLIGTGALGALAVTPAAVACSAGVAIAATACGGNSTSHLAPIDCTNTLTVSGITGGAHLTVTTSGAVHVDAQVNNKQVPLYLQVKAHDGISSNNGFNGATAVFVNGLASVNTQMPGCLSQIDIKIVPGVPTLDHVSDIYRVAAPLVELPNCTVVTTTVPQSSTTTTPSSSTVPPLTTTTPTTTPGGPVESSGTTSGGTHSKVIPATGSNAPLLALVGLGLVVGGLVLVMKRRPA